jgi:hypothetical protein
MGCHPLPAAEPPRSHRHLIATSPPRATTHAGFLPRLPPRRQFTLLLTAAHRRPWPCLSRPCRLRFALTYVSRCFRRHLRPPTAAGAQGRTALKYAAFNNKTVAAKRLIERGADVRNVLPVRAASPHI